MRASEFMTADVLTVSPDTPVKDAAQLLAERGVTAVPVVDNDGHLVGVVSEADLLRGRVEPDPRRHLGSVPVDEGPVPHEVSEVMTRDVVALPDTADESDFARLMVRRQLKTVPVVSGERLVGIVSRRDLLRHLARDDASIRAEVVEVLRQYTGSQVEWEVDVVDGVVKLAGTAEATQRHVAELLARTVAGVARVVTVRREVAAPSDHAGLRVLGLEECLSRLRTTPLGRLAFVSDGDPVVLPVNHAVDGNDVVFRTAAGSKLFAAERATSVAYEVDGYDVGRRYGWSVLVRGVAEAVYEDEVIDRLETLGMDSWADAVERPVWVRVRSEEITGREIVR
jgi:CBS domain-containing protein